MSTFEKAKLVSKGLGFFLPYLGRVVIQQTAAVLHRWTWRNTPDAKNVVVVGGSFAGIELVRRLAQTLPTGYKAVWIEKNSHLNYSFNFPRFSVMIGQEHTAFIPYDGIASSKPRGILTRVQGKAVQVTENQVILASGQKVDYAYLIVATGSSQPLPVNVLSTDRVAACHELQEVQQAIVASQKIAIVGGGAVGVELASDIKDFYPEKDVTLVHSRSNLLNSFGKRLRDYALTALRDELNVRVLLNERPQMPTGSNMARSATLKFSDMREEKFDLIRPNSAILKDLLPDAISEKTSRIIVRPTLQVLPQDRREGFDPPIFALGDVADHGGPCMARAGWLQASVVLDNVLAMIHGRQPSRIYKPNLFIEGAIKLTLGKSHTVMYGMDEKGFDVMFPSRTGPLDLGIERAWKDFGADFAKGRTSVVAKQEHVQGEA
ncbi:FAD/NAD(P)-binding domain-containing protein [Amniculicola lignicola CBS 123094]|uniref:FAD/NAD(P)-binding domain-containing protein n=1 Tax=Amniculicola lignicola CBS 123094 TaxID=1392246 RepID=A0A6A5VVF0_9PLEO|nr:FAD/NAD(P)-binding domain-containing protein [Amniculicola lignicola CBS 123094]